MFCIYVNIVERLIGALFFLVLKLIDCPFSFCHLKLIYATEYVGTLNNVVYVPTAAAITNHIINYHCHIFCIAQTVIDKNCFRTLIDKSKKYDNILKLV